ncbi:hypothetical protein [Streptomyces sp. NPDC054804]
MESRPHTASRTPLETASLDQSRARAFYGVRSRVDDLLLRAVEVVEAEGVTVDGKPHPLLSVITALGDTGTGMRQMALNRRIYGDSLAARESLRGEVTGELENRPHA